MMKGFPGKRGRAWYMILPIILPVNLNAFSKKLQCRQGLEQNRECGQVFEVIMVFVELSIIPQCVNVSS